VLQEANEKDNFLFSCINTKKDSTSEHIDVLFAISENNDLFICSAHQDTRFF